LVGRSFDFDGDVVFRKGEELEVESLSTVTIEYSEYRGRREGGMRDTKSRMAAGDKIPR
jgi:hypothetical protein